MAGQVSSSTAKKAASPKGSARVQVTTGTTSGARKVRRSKPAATTITEGQIRERAFQIYLARRGGPGDACSDWYQAERELRDAPKS